MSYSDFVKAYANCTGFWRNPGSGQKEAVHIQDATDMQLLRIRTPSLDNWGITYSDFIKADPTFPIPTSGLILHRNLLYVVKRKNLRQWKRGICNQTVSMWSPTASHRARLSPFLRDQPFSAASLQIAPLLFETPKVVSLDQAVEQLSSGLPEVLLSRDFGVVASFGKETDGHNLLYHGTWIGKLYPIPKKVVVRHEPFMQEVKDYLKRTGEQTWQV